MTRREWAIRICRGLVVAVGIGLVGALLVASVIGWQATTAARYWQSGYLRLIVACFWDRFDRIAPVAALVGVLVVGGLSLIRRRPIGRAGFRTALAATVLVGALRGLTLLDGWRVARGPNVLLISIDTLRADRLGAYGQELPTSPTIDRRLAAEGVTFERVYSQSPKTTPSHMTMLTSLYPCVHGIELWDAKNPGRTLNPAAHTLAEVLKESGYTTAAFTGGVHVHRSRGFDHGFDRYRDGRQLERTLEWIGEHSGRKWFLFFHTYEVHDPYVPPAQLIPVFAPDYQGPMLAAVERVRSGVAGWDQAHKIFWDAFDTRNPDEVRFVERLYDAGIRAMDEATIAPLLDRLDKLDLARNTLVVFTSDHGEAFGEHGVFMHEDLYDVTLHVPLILRFPGRLPAGRRVPQQASLIDLMPTILELVGVPAPDTLQGKSLVPWARGGDEQERGVTSEYGPGGLLSFRRDGLSYIAAGSREMLFDGREDGREEHDVATTRPDALAPARADLRRWRAECQSLAARFGPRGGTVSPDAETLRQLRALGYVE